MKISPSVAFDILRNNRAAANLAAKSFAVRSLTKSGAVSKSPDSRWNVAATAEEADALRARFEQQNPGRTFVVVAL